MISKGATDKTNFCNQINFTSSARQAWRHVLDTISGDSKILLPSYIGITDREGSGIYDPVINSGLEHDFYLLDDDLSIFIDKLQYQLKSERYDLILLVHYFGFQIENINEVVNLCRKYNLIVIEDCAHLFNYMIYDYSKAGTYGDFVFYSLHKNFPISDGGMLIQNNLEIMNPTIKNNDLNSVYSSQIFKYDIKSIADKRRKNFNCIDRSIKKIDGLRPLKKLNKNDIPHNYPIIVENNLREKLYFWLIERDITLIALYYRLIEPLNINKYSSMQFVSNNILNLPVHQDITTEGINKLMSLIEKGILELQ